MTYFIHLLKEFRELWNFSKTHKSGDDIVMQSELLSALLRTRTSVLTYAKQYHTHFCVFSNMKNSKYHKFHLIKNEIYYSIAV